MRVPAPLWILGVVGASTVVSAVAFGQGSTWGGPAAPARGDAGAAAASSPAAHEAGAPARRSSPRATWGTATVDAGSAGGGEEEAVGEEETEDEDEDAGPAASSAGDAGAPAADGGWSGPSNLGFAIGLRGGYALPFGNVNGQSVRDNVLQGAVPIGADLGWFFTPHVYVGVYFSYGIGLGAGRLNPTCSAPDTDCSGAMYRFGGVVHWHLLPLEAWDPWVGAGLGYELVQMTATSQIDGSSVNPSPPLQALDLTLEAGLDFKPLRYVGVGPYVEVATGPYVAGTSGFDLHGWATLGVRFRLNMF